MKEITTEELKKRLESGEELQLIDVREEEEVEGGMIPEAKHIRMSEIPERLEEIDKGKQTIFICRSGGRSGRVCEYLEEQGYDVVNMVGGMLEWEGNMKPKSELA